MKDDNKPKPELLVRNDGQRPTQESLARELSGLRAAQDNAFNKGRRPLQEGARPVQSEPHGSLGPVSTKPGSGVPPKPNK